MTPWYCKQCGRRVDANYDHVGDDCDLGPQGLEVRCTGTFMHRLDEPSACFNKGRTLKHVDVTLNTRMS